MLKTLIIFSFFAYAFYRFSGKVLEFLGLKQNKKKYKRKPKNGMNINYIPENEMQKQNRSFKGGEYTDFEEID